MFSEPQLEEGDLAAALSPLTSFSFFFQIFQFFSRQLASECVLSLADGTVSFARSPYTEVNMSPSANSSPLLKLFAQTLHKVPDPRSKQGQSYPLGTLLALTFLGLIGNCTNPAELARWSKNQLKNLRPFLQFRR